MIAANLWSMQSSIRSLSAAGLKRGGIVQKSGRSGREASKLASNQAVTTLRQLQVGVLDVERPPRTQHKRDVMTHGRCGADERGSSLARRPLCPRGRSARQSPSQPRPSMLCARGRGDIAARSAWFPQSACVSFSVLYSSQPISVNATPESKSFSHTVVVTSAHHPSADAAGVAGAVAALTLPRPRKGAHERL